ncbi:hypothetical protein MRB53_028172 [Persea americana]|uniref:Uncharacterized protein n=1 Tax=Persea americana TaxID=3435 RepID=A0ACC2KEY9_PERAE|nr:hypothetical protein MRB53_028172 [Persea americana]
MKWWERSTWNEYPFGRRAETFFKDPNLHFNGKKVAAYEEDEYIRKMRCGERNDGDGMKVMWCLEGRIPLKRTPNLQYMVVGKMKWMNYMEKMR